MFVVVVIGCDTCGRPMRALATTTDRRTADDFAARVPGEAELRGGVPSNCARAVVLEVGAAAIDTDPDTLAAAALGARLRS